MKKIIATVLSILLIVAIIPFGTFSITARAATSGYYTYTISNSEATITAVNTSISGAVTIPQTLGGYYVTTIGKYAFAGCENITSITIGDKVKVLEENAFLGCTGITSISIGTGVKSISPSSFLGCISTSRITVASGNTAYYSTGNCIVETETLTLVLGCKNSTLPANGKIGAIGPNAFYGCSGLTSITIPNSVTKIGNSAFAESTFTYIDLGYGVTTIDAYAFAGCEYLEDIIIPDCINFIGTGAFAGCEELYYNVYNNCYYLGNAVNKYLVLAGTKYYDSSSYTLASGVKCIYDEAMSQCVNLRTFTIPNTVTSIGSFAFANCSSLTSLTVPSSVTAVGTSAFIDCDNLVYNTYGNGKYLGNSSNRYVVFVEPTSTSISEFTFASGVKCINSRAFAGCKNLKSIKIPDTISIINEGAFEDCTSLTAISLGDNVKYIYGFAFKGCSSLQTVNFGRSVSEIGGYAFYDCPKIKMVNYRASKYAKNVAFINVGNDDLLNAKWNYLENGEFYGTTTNPVKPIVINYTSDTVMLHPFEGYEFSMDGVNWQISNTFEDLEPETTYTFYQRIKPSSGGTSTSSSIVVTTAKYGFDSDDVYDLLEYYILRDYTNTDSYGDPYIKVNYSSGDFYGYYSITATGSSIKFELIQTGSAISTVGCITTFEITKSSTRVDVSHYLAAMYNGSVVSSSGLSGEAYIDRSEHERGEEYAFYRSNSYFSQQNFCDTFNSVFTLMTYFFDDYLYDNYSMGLRTLGFINFDGYGLLACDPATGYHSGRQETRGAHAASCVVDGYTGNVYCSGCDQRLQSGEVIYCKGYHNYDNDCDTNCNTCGEHRNILHTYSSDCDNTCNVCPAKRSPLANHVFDDAEDLYCNDCGTTKYTPGDIDGVEGVTDRDAVHLLYHTFLPDLYPVNQDCDFNNDGSVNDKDAVYLLYHTFLPDLYPIS